MTSRFERLMMLHQEGKITNEELDTEVDKIFTLDEKQKQKFLERVQEGLQNEKGVMTEDRFDEIADQIEAASPNYWATLDSIRLLGKYFVSSQEKRESNDK